MRLEFEQLYRRMCEPTTFAELQEIYQQLRMLGDSNEDLLEAMSRERTHERWGCLLKLIWAIPEPTPIIFSSMLSQLLDNHRHIEIMEAIADKMYSLKDPDTVGSLVGVLDYSLSGDDDCHFNRKIIYALANIGSPEAISAIRNSLNSPEETIRRTARKELDKLSSSN
jgi:HEAT repeat protein